MMMPGNPGGIIMTRLAAAGLGLLFFALALEAKASGASIVQGTYKMEKSREIGDSTPVVGPVFRVYSESADKYDFVGQTNKNIDFIVSATAFCSSPRREGEIVAEVAGVSASESKRTKLGRGAVVGNQFKLSVPHSSLKSFDAVKACNDGLRSLAAQTDMSKPQLVSKGFTLRYEDVFEAKATAFCTGGVTRGHVRSDRTPVDVWVDCAPNPQAASRARATTKTSKSHIPPPPAKGPFITDKSLVAESPNRISTCPALVKFTGSITASRAGDVTYRLVGHDGSRSPAIKVRFEAAGTKPTRSWTVTARLPEPVPGRLVAPATDDEELPRVKGWQRIEILDPQRYGHSSRAEYSITCVDEPLMFEATPATEPDDPPARAPNATPSRAVKKPD